MKSSTALSILTAVSMAIVGVRGDAVSCSVIDYLYYSSDCCDNSNSVQCMESIPQTDKAAIDNLATLKRADLSDCQAGDSISYAADTGSGSSGIVCTASGPPVDCVSTWSNYSSCVNGEKTRTSTVSTPASGGGTACPASPETAVCTGAIGDACTDNAHCDSNTCDTGVTDVCVAAPTFQLVTDDAGWDVNNAKIIDSAAACEAFKDDATLQTAAEALSAPITTDITWDGALSCNNDYPKGCSLRLFNAKLYWNSAVDGNGAPCSTKTDNFARDPLNKNADTLPVLLP